MLDASFLLLSILGRNITLQMWHVKRKKKKGGYYYLLYWTYLQVQEKC